MQPQAVPRLKPPRLWLDQRFTDIQSMARAVGWTVDFRQTEPGALEARAIAVGHEDCLLTRVQFNRGYHQLGTPPPGLLSFGLVDPESGALRCRGAEVAPGALFNFMEAGQLDAVHSGAFSGYVFTINSVLWRDVMNLLDVSPDKLAEKLTNTPYWTLRAAQAEPLRSLAASIIASAVGPEPESLWEQQDAFDFELPAALLHLTAQATPLPEPAGPPFRERALRRALEVIEDPNMAGIGVAELCRQCHASWATVDRAFMDEFGITPKAYLRARRLAAVNRELVEASPQSTVREIANRWGFWHLGSFSGDYRKQFGELPSETLARGFADG